MRQKIDNPKYDEAWQKARMKALVRDDFACQAHQLDLCEESCGESRLSKLHVHHLKMRINGGSHELDNLLTLCELHHEQIHPWMKKRKAIRQKSLEYDSKTRELPHHELPKK